MKSIIRKVILLLKSMRMMMNNSSIFHWLKGCVYLFVPFLLVYLTVMVVCFGYFFFSPKWEELHYEIPLSADRLVFIVDSTAIINSYKPAFAKREEDYWRQQRRKGDEKGFIALYLIKSKAVIYMNISETKGGSLIELSECCFDSTSGRTDWIGSPFNGGVSFCKAHKMEKEFERRILKNNRIPYEKHKPFWLFYARLMMYPLAYWWQTLICGYILLCLIINRPRSKGRKL